MTHFGEHLTVDGYGGDPVRLNDCLLVKSSLLDLCRLLGMTPLAEACVLSAPDNGLKDPGGWSGFLVLAESHISIHTFPKRRFLSADAYTCRNGLDTRITTQFLVTAFALSNVETNFVIRGRKYPGVNLVAG